MNIQKIKHYITWYDKFSIIVDTALNVFIFCFVTLFKETKNAFILTILTVDIINLLCSVDNVWRSITKPIICYRLPQVPKNVSHVTNPRLSGNTKLNAFNFASNLSALKCIMNLVGKKILSYKGKKILSQTLWDLIKWHQHKLKYFVCNHLND